MSWKTHLQKEVIRPVRKLAALLGTVEILLSVFLSACVRLTFGSFAIWLWKECRRDFRRRFRWIRLECARYGLARLYKGDDSVGRHGVR